MQFNHLQEPALKHRLEHPPPPPLPISIQENMFNTHIQYSCSIFMFNTHIVLPPWFFYRNTKHATRRDTRRPRNAILLRRDPDLKKSNRKRWKSRRLRLSCICNLVYRQRNPLCVLNKKKPSAMPLILKYTDIQFITAHQYTYI